MLARPQTILLDGRPIQEGWLTWQTYNGLLFLPDLLQFLRPVVPPGHSLGFAGAPDLGTYMHTSPGTVVVLDFLLRPPPFYRAAYHPDVAPIATGNGDAASTAARPAGPPAPRPATDDTDPTDVPSPPATVPTAVGTADTADIRAIFLVFCARIPPGTPRDYITSTLVCARRHRCRALCQVTCLRQPIPSSCEVHPQPDLDYGTLLALPAWPIDEVLVYFDLRGIDDRYFALQVPVAMTFASLLAVADLPAATRATIYVRDIPCLWAPQCASNS